MKKPTKKLSLTTETIRNLQSDELTRVVGGSNSTVSSGTSIHASGTSGTSVISSGTSVISSGTSVISRNPSGGIVGH